MAYRIVVQMLLVNGAEARLFALVGQRHVEIESASFHRHRSLNEIHATLEVELDEGRVRRLMRQLLRHQDIQRLSLENTDPMRPSSRRNLLHSTTRRMRVTTQKGAFL